MSDAAVYAFAKATLTPIASEAELQFALAVFRLETGYSTAWPIGQGAGSNNWGADQEPNLSKPHFDHVDTHADGTKYTAHFKVYPSPFHGMTGGANTILKPNVRAALKSGDGDGAVAAMRVNKYFEAPLDAYAAAVRRNHAALVRGAGIAPAVQFGALTSSTGLLLAAAALLLLWK
jgi:hypothetical protein